MAEEEARQDLQLCQATAAVAQGKPTEPSRPQPDCESRAPSLPVHPPRCLPARSFPGSLLCTTRRALGAPRGPVGVPGRARPLARPLAGTMMEEIDRFQVPTAHSEMQPLVRGRAAGRPRPGGGAP